MRSRAVIVLLAALSALAAYAPAQGAASDVHIVVARIDSPRQLAFDSNGDLYAAAAGHGGTEGCGLAAEGPFCTGLNGAVVRVANQDLPRGVVGATTVAGRLISMAFPGGSVAHGIHGVAARGGDVYGLFIGPEMLGTKGSEACCRDNIQGDVRAAAQQQLGNLMQISPAGALTTVADVDHFEFSENPVNDPHSNPYALAIDRDGTFLVADAAGNTIVRVDRSGNVRLVVAFDNLRSSPVAGTPGQVNTEAVPTGIAVGADGNYYVSMLGGLMHPTFGRIVQVTPQGVVRTIADGLTSVSSVTVAPDGTVYGTELAKGDIVRVRPDPARPGRFLAPELMYAGELVTPTGIVAGPDGWVYVSDAGVISGQLGGRIVRVRP